MSKRILLVDDEELFLKNLKEGLTPLSDVFTVDICHSVNQAIKHLVTESYDLVITDIQMPEKTGIELLIYLSDIRFPGKVMVMSAYCTEENSEKAKYYGVLDIIPKPFKLEWFMNLLLEHFKEEKEKVVTSESINLITVMQIINLEEKSSVLEIGINDKKGYIYFVDGEIYHAEYDGLEGERAVMKLVTLDRGVISVKKINKKVKRTMEVPFVHYMMEIMKTIDELRRDQQAQLKKEGKKIRKNNIKESQMAIEEILKTLADVNGYLGAGVFTPQGEILAGSTDISGIHFEEAGSLIHDTLNNSKAMAKKVGFGNLDMLQLYSEMGTVFAKCYNEGSLHFHTILVIKSDGNIAMAKLKLEKVVNQLKDAL